MVDFAVSSGLLEMWLVVEELYAVYSCICLPLCLYCCMPMMCLLNTLVIYLSVVTVLLVNVVLNRVFFCMCLGFTS